MTQAGTQRIWTLASPSICSDGIWIALLQHTRLRSCALSECSTTTWHAVHWTRMDGIELDTQTRWCCHRQLGLHVCCRGAASER
jgi:hypothetical protein